MSENISRRQFSFSSPTLQNNLHDNSSDDNLNTAAGAAYDAFSDNVFVSADQSPASTINLVNFALDRSLVLDSPRVRVFYRSLRYGNASELENTDIYPHFHSL